MNNVLMFCIISTWILRYAVGYYIKPKAEETKHLRDEWSVFQQKLGLSQRKVEQLKSKKNWLDTMGPFHRIIEANPKYLLMNDKKFELNDDENKTTKYLKRSRRKIAVRMVSNIPAEKIDELLKAFNRQHEIEDSDLDENIEESSEDYDETDYSNSNKPFALTSALNPDYMYENIYEDVQDAAASTNINTDSEFTFLQDLILKANGNRWQ
ncbi:uncharacterized protein LOC128871881 [Anastrepha ludens]|uniref:uncharacterized protein LOC128871881 n=1 Tax=Anastrepha ludens TaxID=28586 RepID=UPI0023B06DD4|nr:uncharacterized protein LOC128871881 [Anastrepha ludens]